jgi:uracil-DNA glycosylase
VFCYDAVNGYELIGVEMNKLSTPDFSHLIEKARECTECVESLPYGVNPIFQVSESARILLIGQAPGVRVHQTGIPFDDSSGDRLRQWMGVGKEIFYDASNIAIMPMGFCYPGKGKSGDLPPRKECAPLWHQSFLTFMPNIRLTLLIGQYSQSFYLGNNAKSTLTETVRHWETYWPQFLPLPHPSPRNNIWLKKNLWFENEVVPALQDKILDLFK